MADHDASRAQTRSNADPEQSIKQLIFHGFPSPLRHHHGAIQCNDDTMSQNEAKILIDVGLGSQVM